MNKIFCKDCNKELLEEERPCSNCGCSNRIYKMGLMETIKMKVGLAWKHTRPSFRRPVKEGMIRDKISRDPELVGQEVHEEYVIDRIKKWWHHIVKDNNTDKIIHEEHELLIDHYSKNKKLVK